MSDPNRVTINSERIFADKLCNLIRKYWLGLGYDIKVWVDPPEKIVEGIKFHRAPIFPIRSNIGPYGYPPKRSAS